MYACYRYGEIPVVPLQGRIKAFKTARGPWYNRTVPGSGIFKVWGLRDILRQSLVLSKHWPIISLYSFLRSTTST